jgi:WD40 repeat protein
LKLVFLQLKKPNNFAVIVSCSFDNTVCLFDTTGRGHMRQLTLQGHTDAVVTICLSSKSELVISSGTDNSIRVWDVATGDCIKIIWTKVPPLPLTPTLIFGIYFLAPEGTRYMSRHQLRRKDVRGKSIQRRVHLEHSA